MASKKCEYSKDNLQTVTQSTTDVHSAGVLHLLNSNNPPSGITKAEFELKLAEETEKLASIDARIENIWIELDELMKQRSRAECKIKDYKHILHPIRRLTADVLSNIFLYFANEELEEDEEESSIDPTQMIWRLPRVSQRWRSVALSFPRLWSTIRISLTQKLNNRMQFMLSVQLHRSGSHSLSVSIYTCSDFISNHPLLQSLLPTSERWRDFKLDMPLSSYNKISAWITSFPRLISLHVWFTEKISTNQFSSLEDVTDIVLAVSPDIKHVYTVPHLLPKMPLPFKQIERFGCLSTPSPSGCLEGLRALPYLRRCDFRYYLDSTKETQELEQVQLPHLHTLIICTNEQKPSPIVLLKYLRLPALTHLELTALNNISNLLRCLDQSQCHLTRLRLSSPELTDTSCIRVLKAIPSLTFLTLHCPVAYTKKLLKSLCNTEGRILPSLHFLEIVIELDKGDPYPEWSREDLLEFKEARSDVRLFGDTYLDDN